MTKSGWLKCESVDRGMFSDEFTVVIARSNGSTESYFVPAQDVEPAKARLRVALREAGNLFWATLPTSEPVTLPVNKSKVQSG